MNLIQLKADKSFLFLLIIGFLFVCEISTYAQHQQVNLRGSNLTLKAVFKQIEQQTKLFIDYNTSDINDSQILTELPQTNSVKTVLEQLLKKSGCKITFSNGHAIITKDNKVNHPPKKVSGIVKDEKGEPVIGANIIEKGTTNGTITDLYGAYIIDVPEGGILQISYIGYNSQEVKVTSNNIINFSLLEDTEALEEVVVIGYGQQKKVSITGAVGNIKSENINRLANSTTASMQGTSPGLTILDKGGSPGRATTTLRIRGVTTINNSDALLLVDGVEQRISDINPDDIESVSVLKDASTTAIYGSRAANGVVLVTTKRGKEGGVKIDFNSYWGIQKVTNKPEHMETVTYMKQQNYAFQNAGQSSRYSETFIQEWIDNHKSDPITYREANQWQDAVYRSALQHNYSLTVSGGNEKAKGLMALRYYNQDGVVPNFNSEIKEIRVNTDFTPFKRLKLSADANFRSRYSSAPVEAYEYDKNGGGIFYSMYHATQFVVPRYSDGSYGLGNKNANPLMLAEMAGDDKQWNNLFVGNLKAEVNLTDGLRFITQYAQRYAFNKTVAFTNAYTVTDNNFLDWNATAKDEHYSPNTTRIRKRDISRNSMNDYREDINEYTLNLLLDYEKRFDKHNLHILAGFSQIENKWSHNQAYRQDFYNNDVKSINMGSESSWKSYGYNNEYALRSYFGRVNYNYDNRYLLEGNLRYDGTSRFTGNNQYGTFPSFSVGWRISNEAFWSDELRDIISDLKIRGSWGKTGNQTAGLYAFYESYSSTTYNFSDNVVQGYMQTSLANKDLKWETSTQTNIGIDAGFLDNRLTLTADYYYKRTDGILVSLPISGTIGLDAPVQNAAIVDNKGFELSLDWKDNIGDFLYGLNFNISNNWNEVISLGGANPTISGGASDVLTTVREGYALNSYWGYETDGFLTQNDLDKAYPKYDSRMTLGDIKYIDRNKDSVIDAEDMTVIGNEFPRYPFAFSGNMSWKGFDFSFMFQGVMNAQTRVSGALAEGGNFEGFTLNIFKDYWTPDNTNARFPRPRKSVDYNAMMSDFWVIDANYIRLKNLQLGYTLPREKTKKFNVEKARIYLSGSNLLTFSPLKEWGLDPEFVSGRFLYYPQTTVYTIGLNLTF
ncbi:TonB-dependent receptor [Massilibacteroides sp.]|uniref:SusC/RagA family TonB-linked outer membrane protein n=1 Tax=Massilibacteroides sp. TaxID=2034766 RepID=UPI00263185B5|nr:TonB-dependent receptor [Massilibacteroides sp.]MDD4515884.1 TonB-dependent receptor [Massilibacteroides sp.]